MRNGPRANGRTFGPQRLLDSRDPVRWTGLGKRLSLRPEECVKHPSKPKRSTITVDRKVRQVMGARLAVSCLGKPPPSALRVHRPRRVRLDCLAAVFMKFGTRIFENCAEVAALREVGSCPSLQFSTSKKKVSGTNSTGFEPRALAVGEEDVVRMRRRPTASARGSLRQPKFVPFVSGTELAR